MDEKISIIIPVYKVEQYLAKCLESILHQTYQNLEIILVDDGSPDRCGEICEEYAKKDGRIKVIHKANEGAACARNDGIEAATGEYISFVDSDDWIPENAYEVLYHGLKEQDAECVVGSCVKVVDKNGTLTYKKRNKGEFGAISAQDAMKRVLLNGSAVWNRLFRRELFENVRFPANRINEDEVAALHIYVQCKKVVFLDADTYYYRIRKNSVTTSSFSLRKVDWYYNSLDNLEFIRTVCPVLVPCAECKCVQAMMYCYINLLKMKKTDEEKKVCKELKQDIRKNRSKALKNPYLPFLYKVLMVVMGR